VSEAIVWGIGTEDPNQFPNSATTGTPAGWVPDSTSSADITLDDDEVLEDVRLTDSANINVVGTNVTVRRCELWGGRIINDFGPCGSGLLVEDVSILPEDPPDGPVDDSEGVLSGGSFTARRVEINGRSEGIRVGSNDICGAVVIEDTYVRLVPPTPCTDWHGDGIQGFNGGGITINNMTIDMREGMGVCPGTAPFWWPSGQGNTGDVVVDRFLVMGQGFSFRLHMPGTVSNLKVVDDSWEFGPIDVTCAGITSWEAKIVTIDSDYRITSVVEDQPCE
jgi:hypothetical protein